MATQATVFGPGYIEIPGPPGPEGPPGPANSLTIGTVTTGVQPSANITGTAPNQVLNLQLPLGPPGSPGSPGNPTNLTIGTVTTVPAGQPATATITGTAPNLNLNLGLPAGPTGVQGPPGEVGGAENVGNGIGVFAQINSGILQFKSFVAGAGIVIEQTNTGITIRSNLPALPPNDGNLYGLRNGAWEIIPETP